MLVVKIVKFMSKQRMIDTKFWDDNYSSNLDPIEKLLFLYFLTNTSTNISGIYEIPLKKIAVETGIEKEMVMKILDRFTKDQKVFYYNGWLCLKNFIKNQNQRSPKVQIGIKNEMAFIPKDIFNKFKDLGYGIDTLSHLIKSNSIKEKIEEKQTTLSISYLKEIPESDLEEFYNRFDCEKKAIQNKAESLLLYCQSKGKVYKNYKAFLLNALKKDFPERKEPVKSRKVVMIDGKPTLIN